MFEQRNIDWSRIWTNDRWLKTQTPPGKNDKSSIGGEKFSEHSSDALELCATVKLTQHIQEQFKNSST